MISFIMQKLEILACEDRKGHYDIDGVSQTFDHMVIIASAARPGHNYESCLDHYFLSDQLLKTDKRSPIDIRYANWARSD